MRELRSECYLEMSLTCVWGVVFIEFSLPTFLGLIYTTLFITLQTELKSKPSAFAVVGIITSVHIVRKKTLQLKLTRTV